MNKPRPTLDDIVNVVIAGWKKQHIFIGQRPAYEYVGLNGNAELLIQIQDNTEGYRFSLSCGAFLMDCRTPSIEVDYLKRVHQILHRIKIDVQDMDQNALRRIDVALMTRLAGKLP